jgi:F0F1-type ATP synthase gamma subunit
MAINCAQTIVSPLVHLYEEIKVFQLHIIYNLVANVLKTRGEYDQIINARPHLGPK